VKSSLEVKRSKNCRKDIVIMKLFVWLLQRVAEMLTNLVVTASWPTLRQRWLGIFRMVSVVSFKIFELFFCKKKIPLSRRVGYVMDGSMDE